MYDLLLLCKNKTELDPRCEKGIFVGDDKQSLAYLIYFPDSDIKGAWCVKFTDSYDTKQKDEHTEFSDYISNTYDEKLKDNLSSEGDGQKKCIQPKRRKPDIL